MSRDHIRESLDLLGRDWDVDPAVRRFMLGEAGPVSDRTEAVGGVTFHIPYLESEKKMLLWTCHWPDCHNCCERQGRLPLTADDLVTIGAGLKYRSTPEFVAKETLTVSHAEPGPSGGGTIMTTINLRRREGETAADDGTHVPCRFLGGDGACGLHPGRPGVCYLYPFTTWLESEGGRARVHAAYQITGDCPGFYLAAGTEPMRAELKEYAGIIRRYNMESARTARLGLSAASLG